MAALKIRICPDVSIEHTKRSQEPPEFQRDGFSQMQITAIGVGKNAVLALLFNPAAHREE
jgi:hypothetical protein